MPPSAHGLLSAGARPLPGWLLGARQDRKIDQVLDLQRQMLRLLQSNGGGGGGGSSFRENDNDSASESGFGASASMGRRRR